MALIEFKKVCKSFNTGDKNTIICDNFDLSIDKGELVAIMGKSGCGVAFLDISTGEYLAAEGSYDYIEKLLNNFAPKEVLVERDKHRRFEERFGSRFFTYDMDDWVFTEDAATDKLLHHFGTHNLKGFGIHNQPNAIIAAGAILYYLDITQHTHIDHITSLSRIRAIFCLVL